MFISHRADALGARLLSIMFAMYMSKKVYGSFEYFRFTWDVSMYGKDGYTLPDNGVQFIPFFSQLKALSLDESDEVKICNIRKIELADKEEIFSSEFINKYFLLDCENDISYDKIYTGLTNWKVRNIKHLIRNIKNYKYCDVGIDVDLALNMSTEEYRYDIVEIFQQHILFSERVCSMFDLAKNISAKIGDYFCIHIRTGDLIYGIGNSRKLNKQTIFHSTPLELVVELIGKLGSCNVVLVSDGVECIELIKQYFNRDDIFTIDDVRRMCGIESDNLSNVDLVMFDMIFMSYSRAIYGTYSSVCRVASLWGGVDLIDIHSFFGKNNAFNTILRLHNAIEFDDFQKAASNFYIYSLSDQHEVSFGDKLQMLENALKYDCDNDRYRIHIVDLMLKHNKTLEAEKILARYLDIRHDEFVNTLFLVGWENRFVYEECFKNYFVYSGGNTVYLSYISSLIAMKCEGDIDKAMHYSSVSISFSKAKELFLELSLLKISGNKLEIAGNIATDLSFSENLDIAKELYRLFLKYNESWYFFGFIKYILKSRKLFKRLLTKFPLVKK